MLHVKPVRLMLVAVVVPADTPSLNTSYPVTPTASVLADHDKVNDVCVTEAEVKPVGTVGAVTSLQADVLTLLAVLAALQLAAASRALTVIA